MTQTVKWMIGLACVAVVAVAAGLVLHGRSIAPAAIHVKPAPVKSAPAALPSQTPPPANCLLPGPAPLPPDGNTASRADMKLGHDTIQAFVRELEAYQACRNRQIDGAAPAVTAQQKQQWLDEGNGAIDDADALAAAFSQQIKAFKARTPPPD